MWPFKSKPKQELKEIAVLRNLLPKGKLETSTFLYNLTFKIKFSNQMYSNSGLEFQYDAIHKGFHGYMQFWFDGELITYSWYDSIFPKVELYHPILRLVREHFDLDPLCIEFQKSYDQSKVDKEKKVNNLLDRYKEQ